MPTDSFTIRRKNFAKAREMLGWEPEMGLEVGLRDTWDWFVDQTLAEGE